MTRFVDAAKRISTDCYADGIRKAARSLSRLYDAELRPSGLRVSQLIVLVATAQVGESGAPMRTIARTLAMDPTTMTRNLYPLEMRGLLRVARSPADGRVRFVFLTNAGKRKVEEAFPLWERAQAAVHRRFGERRANLVRSELRLLTEAMHADGANRRR
jgi:DNA-binding MarR family transcriptional regulator